MFGLTISLSSFSSVEIPREKKSIAVDLNEILDCSQVDDFVDYRNPLLNCFSEIQKDGAKVVQASGPLLCYSSVKII